jgi:hypothetical protein
LAFAGIHDIDAETEIDEDFTSASESGDPSTVGTLLVWYKADWFEGLSDGDPVGTWADLSGHGWDAVQAVVASRPLYKTSILNSQPSVRFDGIDDDLDIAGLDFPDWIPFTFMAVTHGGTNLRGLFDSAPNQANTFRFYPDNVVELQNASPSIAITGLGAGCVITVTAEYVTGNRQLTAYRSTTQISQNTGNGNPGFFASAVMGSINGGGAGWYTGDILELAMWDSLLSTADRETVIAYLETKYGL